MLVTRGAYLKMDVRDTVAMRGFESLESIFDFFNDVTLFQECS